MRSRMGRPNRLRRESTRTTIKLMRTVSKDPTREEAEVVAVVDTTDQTEAAEAVDISMRNSVETEDGMATT